MSINRQSFLAFTAEITKTAGLIGTLKHWTREGWHNPMGGGVPQANAAPAGSFSARHPGWMGSSKRWGKIPVGMKSMTVGMTALQLPGALKTEDPSGQGKSRAERVADLGGQTVGGLTAAGAAAVAGVNESTVQRRMKDPGFRQRVTSLRNQMYRECAGMLARSMAAALS